MNPGSRRRRSLVVVVLGSIVIFGATAVFAYFARPERVAAITAQAQVDADGSAQITETIGYRFAGVNKHGIFRDVPGLSTTAAVSVTDGGRSTPVVMSSTVGGQTHVRIGDPARTVTGDHVYRVSYPLPTLMAGNDLAWNGVGTGWTVSIDRAALDVDRAMVVDRPSLRSGHGGHDRRLPGHPARAGSARGADQGPRRP